MECVYIEPSEESSLLSELAEIGYMIHSMIEKADQFCGFDTLLVRESRAEYFVSVPDSGHDHSIT